MGNTANGVKAGVVAGVVYGIVLGILGYFTVISEKSRIITALTNSLPPNSPFTLEQLYGIVVLVTPIILTIGGVIGGLIVGALYGKLFERIPGGSATVKGIMVAIVLWLILSVVGEIGNIQYGVAAYLSAIGVGLASALMYGFLLGYFYGRFSRPKETYELKDDVGALKSI